MDGVRFPRTEFARFTLATADSVAASLGARADVALHLTGSALLPSSDPARPRAAVVSADMPIFARWHPPVMLAGRMYEDAELRAGEDVAAITDGLTELVLPGADSGKAVGRTVALSGTPFRVVGVTRSKGDAQATIQAAFSWGSLPTAAAISVIIGLAFGMYPALRAARLSPVDAMRTE